MPRMKRAIKGCGYNPKAHVAVFRYRNIGVIVKPNEIIMTDVEDEAASHNVMDRIINFVQKQDGSDWID